MQAADILLSVAIVLLAVTIRDDLKARDQITPARKTWLLVAVIFAVVSAVLRCLI